MDIFVVILLLALTNKQTMITSKIHIGVYFFVGAITLSMITSQIILGIARKIVAEEEGEHTYCPKRHWMLFEQLYIGWTVPLLVIVSAAALIDSIHATFLRISQFLLISRSYSIYDTIELLQANKHWVLFIIVVGSMVFIPLIRLALLFVIWIIQKKRCLLWFWMILMITPQNKLQNLYKITRVRALIYPMLDVERDRATRLVH